MDFMPDDVDEYMERHERIDQVMRAIHDEQVETATDELVEICERLAGHYLATGNIDAQEVVTAITGTVAGLMADWYAQNLPEDEDGEARNG